MCLHGHLDALSKRSETGLTCKEWFARFWPKAARHQRLLPARSGLLISGILCLVKGRA